ncbi:hypothetical protein AAFX91_25760 [Bradyrhizobium sp. 31Argb]|uniref:hypothetical protein n=1 Tax=unclassified Bradyrhizobium TaxID=2631580 RepID=UPI00249F7A5A|nr:hypothetical protein [Bradyrhizobium sp. Arg237L]MDI4233773.1 hypothetical protein [Bradyrhizobium sp. Arg237L]
MSWASSLDHIWRSATFPMWLTLAAAGFFGVILLITLLRAEKSVANGALTVITLLAIAVAAAATIRGFDSGSRLASADVRSAQPVVAAPAALACIDDLAGDAVLNACEKVLFGSADSAAAAVAYAASQITRLTSLGDLATAERNTSPELQALRRAIERDRYGLMAYVLMARDHCTPASCAAFGSLGTSQQIASNMDERLYENLITRYAPSWNAPAPAIAAAAGAGVLGALPPSLPTGKPTNAEFPSAANTPPISIMTPEPAPKPPQAATAATTAAPPAPRSAPAASPAPPAAAKKQAVAKRPPAPAPVPITPPPPASTAAPATSDD